MHPVLRSILMVAATASLASAQFGGLPTVPSGQPHRLFRGDAPPGVIGGLRSAADAARIPAAVAGYIQPVRITGPAGTVLEWSGEQPVSGPKPVLTAGLVVGAAHRFRVTGIPNAEGAEVHPSIEVIDRTYPPAHLRLHYPIEVRLDADDLMAALDGRLVTRVIYLEDNETAAPIKQTDATDTPIEAAVDQDPLAVADRLGRPVAIVRIGSLLPPRHPDLLVAFNFGNPAVYEYEPADFEYDPPTAMSEPVSITAASGPWSVGDVDRP